ncbi:tripartite tricarboxylate transporter substrate binding protein [Roseomonas sp. SSH11]|uniref:Tripartite tricarboxylate transporter substrate binding protein n=1 Tax=Pararoseomonas baculiformis TaxID=2820812 RepID=A0ABS4AEG2_9PROT|nr:tripartite tricarboxylate transporter substrate binding protein [Pararoseomonas baculiformis]MBP0445392.1 tripartite tricarboxylate transporter substrate binding protein [Pararoseomonas baculiformis]
MSTAAPSLYRRRKIIMEEAEMHGRRGILAGAAALAAAGPWHGARAAWEPTRPIQFIVGFAPGGGADLAARAIAEASSPFFPAPIVVINRPGAGGAIAAQHVADLAPDGLNLLVGGGSESTSLPAFRELPYDPKRSFRSIIRLTRQPLLIVARRGSRFSDLQSVVEAARRSPGTISHASSGQGSIYHAVFVLLSKAAGVELLHVPFTGGGPSLQALLSNTVELAVLAPEEMVGLAESGDVRPLGVASAERLPGYPSVPTLRELGWNVVVENMKGLCAPAGLPDDAYSALHDRFRRGMQTPVWRNFLERTGAMDGYLDGPGFQAVTDSVIDALRGALGRT